MRIGTGMVVGLLWLVPPGSQAAPSSGCRAGEWTDGHGNEVIEICGEVGAGGAGGGGRSGGTSSRTGGAPVRPGGERTGPVRTGSGANQPGQQPVATAQRPLSQQPEGCAGCQQTYADEMALARATFEGCKRAGEEMAVDMCEGRHLMPDGSLVDDYTCRNQGGRYSCAGPGIDRCKRFFKSGMPGMSEGASINVGVSVPTSAGASRTVTLNFSPVSGYFPTCIEAKLQLSAQASTNQTMCGRRVLQERGGVCTF